MATRTGHKLAVVVPTLGRPELHGMLESLASQNRHPDEVIVIDEGDDKGIAGSFPRLKLRVLTLPKESASAKRNAGIQAAGPGATLVAFMDDDIVLEPGSLQAMLDFWETAPDDVAGASFNLVNHPPLFAARLKSRRITSWLGLYDARGGVVLRSGFHTLLGCVPETRYVSWLPSTAVVYRRQVLCEHSFDEWYQDYSYLEDLDLSYSIGRTHRLAVVAEARFHHFPSSVGRTNAYLFGQKEVLNRLHFVGKHPELSAALCCFALLVRISMSALLGIARFDGAYFKRVMGNFAGFLSALTVARGMGYARSDKRAH